VTGSEKDENSSVIYMKPVWVISLLLMLGSVQALAAPKGSPWGADYFTNVELLNQDGKVVHFYDDLIKDKIVVISFIFTHCGDSCPAETASLRQVQKLLGDRMGKDIFFYSISIDPEHDTPKVLKDYAERFKVGPGWSFLTGKKADITLLRKTLGLFRDDVEASKLAEHTTTIMIGNEATGQWVKRSPFDEPKVLAWMIGRSLSSFKAYQDAHNSHTVNYDQAQKIAKLGKGEELFRSRCDSCHSLGKEDGLGPGLQGVTKVREKAWLTRWLKTPDKLLAEKDPIAVDLYNRYNKIVMPNLKLSDSDVEAIIDYMEANDKR
jgi:protein SCO1/2